MAKNKMAKNKMAKNKYSDILALITKNNE